MTIPITVFLFIYLILVLGWLTFTFFNIFHALKFGFSTKANKYTLAIYIIVSALLLVSSLVYVGSVDWAQTIELLSII